MVWSRICVPVLTGRRRGTIWLPPLASYSPCPFPPLPPGPETATVDEHCRHPWAPTRTLWPLVYGRPPRSAPPVPWLELDRNRHACGLWDAAGEIRAACLRGWDSASRTAGMMPAAAARRRAWLGESRVSVPRMFAACSPPRRVSRVIVTSTVALTASGLREPVGRQVFEQFAERLPVHLGRRDVFSGDRVGPVRVRVGLECGGQDRAGQVGDLEPAVGRAVAVGPGLEVGRFCGPRSPRGRGAGRSRVGLVGATTSSRCLPRARSARASCCSASASRWVSASGAWSATSVGSASTAATITVACSVWIAPAARAACVGGWGRWLGLAGPGGWPQRRDPGRPETGSVWWRRPQERRRRGQRGDDSEQVGVDRTERQQFRDRLAALVRSSPSRGLRRSRRGPRGPGQRSVQPVATQRHRGAESPASSPMSSSYPDASRDHRHWLSAENPCHNVPTPGGGVEFVEFTLADHTPGLNTVDLDDARQIT